MNPEQFCYWLQGYMEISKATTLDEVAVEEIKNHLALVFTKVTPEVPATFPTLPTGWGDWPTIPEGPYCMSYSNNLIC